VISTKDSDSWFFPARRRIEQIPERTGRYEAPANLLHLSETHQIKGYGAKPTRLRFGAGSSSATGLGRAGPFEGEVVKRIRVLTVLTVLGMLAVALPIGLVPGSPRPTTARR
jgi:hypothetical protein